MYHFIFIYSIAQIASISLFNYIGWPVFFTSLGISFAVTLTDHELWGIRNPNDEEISSFSAFVLIYSITHLIFQINTGLIMGWPILFASLMTFKLGKLALTFFHYLNTIPTWQERISTITSFLMSFVITYSVARSISILMYRNVAWWVFFLSLATSCWGKKITESLKPLFAIAANYERESVALLNFFLFSVWFHFTGMLLWQQASWLYLLVAAITASVGYLLQQILPPYYFNLLYLFLLMAYCIAITPNITGLSGVLGIVFNPIYLMLYAPITLISLITTPIFTFIASSPLSTLLPVFSLCYGILALLEYTGYVHFNLRSFNQFREDYQTIFRFPYLSLMILTQNMHHISAMAISASLLLPWQVILIPLCPPLIWLFYVGLRTGGFNLNHLVDGNYWNLAFLRQKIPFGHNSLTDGNRPVNNAKQLVEASTLYQDGNVCMDQENEAGNYLNRITANRLLSRAKFIPWLNNHAITSELDFDDCNTINALKHAVENSNTISHLEAHVSALRQQSTDLAAGLINQINTGINTFKGAPSEEQARILTQINDSMDFIDENHQSPHREHHQFEEPYTNLIDDLTDRDAYQALRGFIRASPSPAA